MCDAGACAPQVVVNKADTLVPYMFSLAIENSKLDGYFTEKLLDCFLTGVVCHTAAPVCTTSAYAHHSAHT